jgi:hypothetical protein
MSKGDKKNYGIEVEYSSTGSPLDMPYMARPPCEIVALASTIFGVKFVPPDRLPVAVRIERSEIPKAIVVQQGDLQTLVQFFPEINPSY